MITRWAAKYGEDDTPDMATAAQLEEFLADSAAFVVRPQRAFSIIERPDDFGPRATRWVW